MHQFKLLVMDPHLDVPEAVQRTLEAHSGGVVAGSELLRGADLHDVELHLLQGQRPDTITMILDRHDRDGMADEKMWVGGWQRGE